MLFVRHRHLSPSTSPALFNNRAENTAACRAPRTADPVPLPQQRRPPSTLSSAPAPIQGPGPVTRCGGLNACTYEYEQTSPCTLAGPGHLRGLLPDRLPAVELMTRGGGGCGARVAPRPAARYTCPLPFRDRTGSMCATVPRPAPGRAPAPVPAAVPRQPRR
jgi:hypothetical protein